MTIDVGYAHLRARRRHRARLRRRARPRPARRQHARRGGRDRRRAARRRGRRRAAGADARASRAARRARDRRRGRGRHEDRRGRAGERVAEVVEEVARPARADDARGSPVLAVSRCDRRRARRAPGGARSRSRDRVAGRRRSAAPAAAAWRSIACSRSAVAARSSPARCAAARWRAATILRRRAGPASATVRVREVQVHGRDGRTGRAGRVGAQPRRRGRVDRLERGVVLTTRPGASSRPTGSLVALRPAPARAADAPAAPCPPDRTRVAVHVGTAQVARRRRAERTRRASSSPDGETTAILRLDRPIALAPGDRFVLRRPSPAGDPGGGRVLDPPPAARRRAAADDPGAARARCRGRAGTDGVAAARLDAARRGRRSGAGARGRTSRPRSMQRCWTPSRRRRRRVATAELVRAGAASSAAQVGGARPATRDRDGRPRASSGPRSTALGRDRLADPRRGPRPASRARPPTARPPSSLAAMDRLVAAARRRRTAAARGGGPRSRLRRRRGSGRSSGRTGSSGSTTTSPGRSPTWRDLAARALAMAAAAPLTPAAYRDATGTSRKYVMAILEDLDRRAILRRTPAGHVPGSARSAGRGRDGAGSRDVGGPGSRHGAVTGVGGDRDRPGRRPLEPVRVRQARRAGRRCGDPARASVLPASRRSSTEVIVVLAPGDDRRLPMAGVPVRRVADPEPFEGPLVGLLAGLEAVDRADRPRGRRRHARRCGPAVLAALVRALLAADASTGAAVLATRGRLVPLPAALRTGRGERRGRGGSSTTANVACGRCSRGCRPGSSTTCEWRPLDPEGDTLRDVDRPEDL